MRPITPSEAALVLILVLHTLYKSKDLLRMQQELHGAYCLPKIVNLVLEKAGKALDWYISTAVGAQAEIESLKAKLGPLAPQEKQKRVHQDPDTKFAQVHEVVEA